MPFPLELLLLLLAAGAACALPGAFLVLRRQAMVADALSHVLLFGIAVAYLIFRDLDSPWLFFGAAASGVLTVALVEWLQTSRFIKADAAIGLVFPALFALGAILIALFVPKTTHLDVDQVLLGSPEFGAIDAIVLDGRPIVAKGTVLLTGLFSLELGFVLLLWKELSIGTFDPLQANLQGFRPRLLHYLLMALVSATAVAAFSAVGPITVVALFVVPAASAKLLATRLSTMIAMAVGFGLAGGLIGVPLALWLDTNVGGTMATVLGLLFAAALTIADLKAKFGRYAAPVTVAP